MAEAPRLAYLIAQYPAINHGYLLEEVRHLRRLGLDVRTVSVSLPDRSLGEMTPDECEESKRTFYIKSAGVAGAFARVAGTFLRRPLAAFRALRHALSLAGCSLRSVAYHLFYFGEAAILARWMEQNSCTHVHASFSVTVAALACRMYPARMSFGVYGYGELYDAAGWHLREKIADAVFVRAISRHSQSQLMLSCPPEHWHKLVPVHLGIDPLVFRPRPFRPDPSPFNLIAVGRLAPEKAHRLLFTALAGLVRAGRAVRLYVVGDGPDRAALEAEAARLDISGHVVFEGRAPQERLMKLYGEADAAVMASLYEGTPLVLMEAMAMEIPCVAPCITGIPEMIRHQIEGLLFTPVDEDALAAALRLLMDSPALRRNMGQAARQKILAEFDMRRNAEVMATVLRRRFGLETAVETEAAAARALHA